MNEVTPADIIAWQKEIKEKNDFSESYLRMLQNQVTALFIHATKIYALKDNPCKRVKKMGRSDDRSLTFWTLEEYQKFIDTFDKERMHYVMFELLFWTGMREGELLALTKDDFDFGQMTVKITKTYFRINREDVITAPKTDNSIRTIDLPQFLVDELKEYCDRLYKHPSDARLFPIVAEALQHTMRRHIAKAEVKKIRVQDFNQIARGERDRIRDEKEMLSGEIESMRVEQSELADQVAAKEKEADSYDEKIEQSKADLEAIEEKKEQMLSWTKKPKSEKELMDRIRNEVSDYVPVFGEVGVTVPKNLWDHIKNFLKNYFRLEQEKKLKASTSFAKVKEAEKSYNGNTYHEICIHPDKITIYGPGTYASSYQPEDYINQNLPSAIRNATISKILYLNKSIEQFGSGFKRINSLCKDARLKYSYEISELGFTFIVYRKDVTAMNDEKNVTANVTVNVTLNKTEQAVYNLLVLNQNYTRDELAEATSKTVRTIQRVLDSLKSKNLIERVGSDKSGYWKIL